MDRIIFRAIFHAVAIPFFMLLFGGQGAKPLVIKGFRLETLFYLGRKSAPNRELARAIGCENTRIYYDVVIYQN